MVTLVIQVFESIRVQFTLFCLKSWKIGFEVCFTTSYKITIIFNFVRSVTFDTPRILGSIYKDSMLLLPTILILRDI